MFLHASPILSPPLPALAALYLHCSGAEWAALWVCTPPSATLSSHKWPFGDCHSCHFLSQSLVLCVSVFVHVCLFAHVCVWKKAWVTGKRKESSPVWSQTISYSHLKVGGLPFWSLSSHPFLQLASAQFSPGCWAESRWSWHLPLRRLDLFFCSPCILCSLLQMTLPAPYSFRSHAGSPLFCAYFLENCL